MQENVIGIQYLQLMQASNHRTKQHNVAYDAI